MEGLLDRTSPRRGSLTSLHRQSSNSSFSSTHNGKFSTSQHQQQTTAPSTGSTTTTNTATTTTSNNPDIDKYTRYFIIKAVQIIVQSRVCGNKELRSECKPNGNDWFNINLTDIPEISERTKAAIDTNGVSMKNDWRVCCEISLKTSDGTRIVLEEWLITNRFITIVSTSSPRTKTGSSSPNTSTNINLNKFTSNTSSQQQQTSQNNNSSNGSLTNISNNKATNCLQQEKQSSSGSSNSASSIYTIYNRMSLLLKTLMTTAHIVPAYRLASKVSRPSVICYRIYTVNAASSCQNLSASNAPLPSKNNPLNVSPRFGSLDENLDHQFGPSVKLGSIKTDTNELSVCYRTDISSSSHLLGSPRALDFHRNRHNPYWCKDVRMGGMIQDQDYLIAAKQLLAGNGYQTTSAEHKNPIENSDDVSQPLLPAFATHFSTAPFRTNNSSSLNQDIDNNNDTGNQVTKNDSHLYGELIESAFDNLLMKQRNDDCETRDNLAVAASTLAETRLRNGCERSASIQVPKANTNYGFGRASKAAQHFNNNNNQPSPGSTPKSLSDSYVFVDVNPPFASEEQNDINSFFHGPSPSFSNGFDSLKDVDELTNQLANIEANASQIDDFVDNICVSEDEEDEDDDYDDRERSG